MSIQHKINKLRSPVFAHSFADLMMGAMGIIIVLLIFLKIVEIKGQGSVVAESELSLPPGLRDLNAHPLVRLRLSVCGSDLEKVPINVSVTSTQKPLISKGKFSNCAVENYVFPEGLLGTPLILSSVGGSDTPISILFSVGGYAFTQSIPSYSVSNKTLAIINPENRKIIEVR